MKSLLSHGLTALCLTAAIPTIALPGRAQPPYAINHPASQVSPALPSRSQATTVAESVNVPVIISSGSLGWNHFIRIAVNNMSLTDLMIALPPDMEQFDTVQIADQTGKDIPAQITVSKERVTITFAQPVRPGTTLEVLFTGIQMRSPGGEVLLYNITAERVGLRGEIPIGTARIHTPSRS